LKTVSDYKPPPDVVPPDDVDEFSVVGTTSSSVHEVITIALEKAISIARKNFFIRVYF
jgi:hypothetical protein